MRLCGRAGLPGFRRQRFNWGADIVRSCGVLVANSHIKTELSDAAKHLGRYVRTTGPIADVRRELLLTTVGRDGSRFYDHMRHIFTPRHRYLQGAIHLTERCLFPELHTSVQTPDALC